MFLQIVFWSLVGLCALLGVFWIEKGERSRLGPVTAMVLIFFCVAFFVDRAFVIGLWDGASKDWGATTVRVLVYAGIGVGWSFFKWFALVKRYGRTYLESVERHKKHMEERIIQGNDPEKVRLQFNKDIRDSAENLRPKATEEKEQLSTWILFWPLSVVRYVAGKAIIDILNRIVSMFGGVYNKITSLAFPKVPEYEEYKPKNEK